jgi:hypothetical protein
MTSSFLKNVHDFEKEKQRVVTKGREFQRQRMHEEADDEGERLSTGKNTAVSFLLQEGLTHV